MQRKEMHTNNIEGEYWCRSRARIFQIRISNTIEQYVNDICKGSTEIARSLLSLLFIELTDHPN